MCKTLEVKQTQLLNEQIRHEENKTAVNLNEAPLETMQQQTVQTELQTGRVLNRIGIQIPQETIKKHAFADNSTSIKCAIKRRKEARTRGTVLYNKKENARQVEAAAEAWEVQMKRRRLELAMEHDDTILTGKGGDDVACFLTENQEMNERLIHGLDGQEESLHRLGRTCFEQIMALDFNLDLRNDATFAGESYRLEDITRKVDAWYRLTQDHEGIADGLTDEEKRLLAEKMEKGKGIACYYRAQRKVITNPYYRTHYNSEISHRFNRKDSLEQKNLAMLLWQAEALRSTAAMEATSKTIRWVNTHDEEYTQEDLRYAERARAAYRTVNIYQEYGKNNSAIEDSPHAAYFRQHNHPEDPINKRLTGAHYRVTGLDVAMSESFVRYLSNLPRWKAVQAMAPEEVRTMVENLAKEPVNKENPTPEEIEECKQANLEGVRQFKGALKRQMDYLNRKYGNGFLLLSYEEFVAHAPEFQNDFTNMQGLGCFLTYIKKIPGMFDPSDPSDVEMEKSLNYFQFATMVEGMTKNFFMDHQGGMDSFSQYKMQTSRWLAGIPYNQGASDILDKSDTMHLKVKWDEPFNR